MRAVTSRSARPRAAAAALSLLLLLLASAAGAAAAAAAPGNPPTDATAPPRAVAAAGTVPTVANVPTVATASPLAGSAAGAQTNGASRRLRSASTDRVGLFLRTGDLRLTLPPGAQGDEWEATANEPLRGVACDGPPSLRWSTPCSPMSYAAAVADAANRDPSGPARRRELFVTAASGNHTGLYCCSSSGEQPHCDAVNAAAYDDRVKCVYIFVKDPLLPIVEPSGQTTIQVTEGKNATFDCRPSSRGVQLQLHLRTKIAENWVLDARRGFSKRVEAMDSGLYKCLHGNIVRKFYLELNEATTAINPPHLDVPLLLREGATMFLNCSALVPLNGNAHLKFLLGGPNAYTRLQLAEMRMDGLHGQRLQVQEAHLRNVTARDSGEVCCEVIDHNAVSNKTCREVTVRAGPPAAEPEMLVVLDAQPPFAHLEPNEEIGAIGEVARVNRPDVVLWYVYVAWEGRARPLAQWISPDSSEWTTVQANSSRNSPNKASVVWSKPLETIPSAGPGVARQATIIVKVPTEIGGAGNYSLRVSLGKRTENLTLTVIALGRPQLILLNQTLEVASGSELRADCEARADPAPDPITWYWVNCTDAYRCDPKTEEVKNGRVDMLEIPGAVYSVLTVPKPPLGKWLQCRAANKHGQGRSRAAKVQAGGGAGGARGPSPGLVGGVVGVLALIIGVAASCIYITLRQKRERRRLHCAVGLQGLVAVEPGSLDPTLPADEQAEQLPYDSRWEFPREDLILGRQLGAGAFGVVMKAEAKGIIDDEDITTVAVKMVKRGADDAYLRALASELKILVHLGRHLNVVNLLGACTGRIMERELLVIVEYCPFGNLHNYLLRHRDGFVDQVDPRSGRVDAARGAAQLAAAEAAARRARMLVGAGESSTQITLGSPKGSVSCSGSGSGDGLMTVTYCPTGDSCHSGGSGYDSGGASVPLSPLPDDSAASSGGPQPLWRTFYRCDTRAPSRVLCTADLLSWAFQVACGMQYLALRKVLHGDLAARNVLLARDGIVKICDFGLARSMYKSDTYKKKGDGPLPIKWMALESIRDRIFSTQSDVWSFGVVMWELFSLGSTPYPGMQPSEEFYNKLLSGYRMECPQYAPVAVYELMATCWETDPNRRPEFEALAADLAALLDDSTRERFERLIAYEHQRGGAGGECDYLAMLGSPDYKALTSPDEHLYVNTPPGTRCTRPMMPEPLSTNNPDPEPGSEYLSMSRPSTPGSNQVSFY